VGAQPLPDRDLGGLRWGSHDRHRARRASWAPL
jgi:hypothetical protein